jgi:hypothetical protein
MTGGFVLSVTLKEHNLLALPTRQTLTLCEPVVLTQRSMFIPFLLDVCQGAFHSDSRANVFVVRRFQNSLFYQCYNLAIAAGNYCRIY